MSIINEDKLELKGFDGGGEPIFYYNNKPFTGTLVKYNKDATIAYEQEYINGYNEGWCRSYYSNGEKEQEYKSHNNVIVQGTFKKWDENGNLLNSF